MDRGSGFMGRGPWLLAYKAKACTLMFKTQSMRFGSGTCFWGLRYSPDAQLRTVQIRKLPQDSLTNKKVGYPSQSLRMFTVTFVRDLGFRVLGFRVLGFRV